MIADKNFPFWKGTIIALIFLMNYHNKHICYNIEYFLLLI